MDSRKSLNYRQYCGSGTSWTVRSWREQRRLTPWHWSRNPSGLRVSDQYPHVLTRRWSQTVDDWRDTRDRCRGKQIINYCTRYCNRNPSPRATVTPKSATHFGHVLTLRYVYLTHRPSSHMSWIHVTEKKLYIASCMSMHCMVWNNTGNTTRERQSPPLSLSLSSFTHSFLATCHARVFVWYAFIVDACASLWIS